MLVLAGSMEAKISQTYPVPPPAGSYNRQGTGTAMTNPTPTDATLATNQGTVYHPNIWSEKVKNHPGSSASGTGWENIMAAPADPDFTNVVLVAKSMNMPY